ncbi:Quinolinate phosphoribosyl transferase [Auriculariales sp. MPI-PUGE-AT-0066]|nr:Quinolinate phosphoribosyl transferase [Auriculariales sp. MPI-PUGE-AT-0066]
MSEYAHLLPPSWKTDVAEWLKEDVPSFDYGGFVVGEDQREAFLLGKGTEAAIFKQLDCTIEWHVAEGAVFTPVTKARMILLGERVALNLLARCSGIATKCTLGSFANTLVGFRLVEKYGMLVGGVDCHRHDLSSMIMLKDNHVWSTGSITTAVQKARSVGGFALRIEVEVQSEQEADEAIAAGADIVMLDNFDEVRLAESAKSLKDRWGSTKRFLLETSGNITEQNLATRAINGIDILSTSAIHQSVQHVDFSLKLQVPH